MDVKSMEPLVSVVIPIYNVEEYLDRCVTSVVNQTHRNLEIILVDDGSPDNCPAMCDAWAQKDSRVRVIHKKNAGLGMARNSGIEEANGKYICFFDSDDYVDSFIVEKCVANAEEHGSDAVVFGRWDVFEDGHTEKKFISAEKTLYQGEEIQKELLPEMFTYDRGFGVSVWGKFYKFEIFQKYGLRFRSEREVISEDAFFALEFYSKVSIVTIIPENLYFYYSRAVSLSRQYREDRQEKNDCFFVQSIDYIRLNNLPTVVADHLTVRYHSFTIAALKQTMGADMTVEEKKKKVMEILDSSVLRESLNWNVLK